MFSIKRFYKILTFIIIAISILNVFAKDSFFITDEEYAQMLYKQPRGISCVKCHGKYGEEKLIYNYMYKNRFKMILAPNIRNMTFNDFSYKMKHPKGLMPTYDLTDNEIKMLHDYLNRSL